MVFSLPMILKNSASFSQSIRNRLRLKNLQAQAKNFCRVLDIRVPEIMEPYLFTVRTLQYLLESLSDIARVNRLFRLDAGREH